MEIQREALGRNFSFRREYWAIEVIVDGSLKTFFGFNSQEQAEYVANQFET